MKLVIICKDDNKKYDSYGNMNENKEEVLKFLCEGCRGNDIKTTIKMIMEDYGDEIKEVVYPNCDILKRVMK